MTRIAVPLPVLMLVAGVDRLIDARDQESLAAAVDGGVSIVHVRADRVSASDAGCAVRVAKSIVADRALVLVSARIDGAPGGSADGVHIPDGFDSHADVHGIVSRAVHSVAAAREAERAGADMLVLGTVFASRSHPGGPTIGLEGVRVACAPVNIPVIGIGGITKDNATDVIDAGASGVAVISAIYEADDPRAAASELRRAIDSAWERHQR